jgi:hypothetical protein
VVLLVGKGLISVFRRCTTDLQQGINPFSDGRHWRLFAGKGGKGRLTIAVPNHRASAASSANEMLYELT